MKSRPFRLTIFAWLSLAPTITHSANTAKNVTDLEQLFSKVERVVPAGWKVEFDLTGLKFGSTRPVLMITAEEELPVEYLGPGRSGNPEIDISRQEVSLWLAFMPYMTPQEYEAVRKQNEELSDQREAFIAKHWENLRDSGFKSGYPPPPFSIKSALRAETQLVREYAFLWMDTEPQQLPTHHYGSLAMWFWPSGIKIHEEKWDKEYHRIAEAVEQIVTPYERK